MDIGNLLIEADSEVAYDRDDFETIDVHHDPGVAARPKDISQLLQSAAGYVARTEERESKELFKNAAAEAIREVQQLQESGRHDRISSSPQFHDSDDNNDHRDKLQILADASKEVNSMLGGEHSDVRLRVFDSDPKEQSRHKNHEAEDDSKDNAYEEISEGPEEPQSASDDDEEEFNEDESKEFIFAIHQGRVDVVRNTVRKSGVSVKFVDRHGWTPLHWASSKGNTEIMEIILEHRTKTQKKSAARLLNAQDKLAGWTPLHVSYS
jgi:ankyrin repeat protein